MGGRATKPATNIVSAATVQKQREALRAARQAAASANAPVGSSSSEAVAAITSRGQPDGAIVSSPAASSLPSQPPSRPSRPQVPEADMELIKAMNELGPAIKTMRQADPRKEQIKQVSARDELPNTIPEETLQQLLMAKRLDKAFSMDTVAKANDLRLADLEIACKYLGVPKIVERQGIKYGYWPHLVVGAKQ